ncbi:MAG: ABC transporter permease [Syntrophobacteraceae bacterium]
MILSSWTYRRFIWENAWRELWFRYVGSVMGFLWNAIHPLFQILIYTLVFSQIIPARIPNMSSGFGFAIYLCSGLIPWMGFSETVTRCTNSFIANANYLKKVSIPEQVFVIQNASSCFMNLAISVAIFIAVCIVLGHSPALSWLALPLVLVLLQGFGFGLGLFLGVMNAFFRDISQALTLFLQLWFWITPIVYMESVLPDWARGMLYLNPIFYFVRASQNIIVERTWPHWSSFAIMFSIAAGFSTLGYLTLIRLRSEIRDAL